MVANIGDNNTPQYSVGAYTGSVGITGAGNGVVITMNGCSFFQLAANTTYYVWFESNVTNAGVNTYNWYTLLYLRP